MPLRPKSFYEDHGIELMTPIRVTKLDVFNRKITFDDGNTLEFDRALLATGGRPRRLDIPNMNLKNIFTLRSFDDCDAIIAAAEKASKVVVIGASFIGMETAFSLSRRDLGVTVMAPEKVPFENVFGPEVGKMFRSLHEEMGVNFRLGVSVERFEGTDTVEAVILKGGDRIETDLVIVGIGVVPATEYIEGLELGPDGSVKVDEHMQAADNIYAAGDIARFTDWRTGTENRIEHWRTAEQQGRYAAHNMAGKHVEYRSVPFFWTAQAGLHFRYVGHAREWDDVLIDGDIAQREFIVYYVKGNTVLAAGGHARDQQMDIVEELIRTDKMPDAKTLQDEAFDLNKFLKG
jgi:NADPH-dependent 2,4-dienoyl-CoA reductase/sulfur reductase-like enzyme